MPQQPDTTRRSSHWTARSGDSALAGLITSARYPISLSSDGKTLIVAEPVGTDNVDHAAGGSVHVFRASHVEWSNNLRPLRVKVFASHS